MAQEEDITHADELLAEGRYDEAISYLTRLLQAEPDDADALWRLGVAYTEDEEPERALKALEFFLTLNDTHPGALEACGCAEFKRKNYQQAQTYLRRAAELMPDSASIKRNLGVVHNQLGEPEQSYEQFRRSYELNPDDYRTAYALAMAHIQYEEWEAACEVLGRMLEQELPEDFLDLAKESFKYACNRAQGHGESEDPAPPPPA
jgi:tetratricopeptide (TPR) repeat protein